jgi:hypothetical protein
MPEGVLGLFHVTEETAEMNDASRVRLVELDPPRHPELALLGVHRMVQ